MAEFIWKFKDQSSLSVSTTIILAAFSEVLHCFLLQQSFNYELKLI